MTSSYFGHIKITSREPVERKSSVCLIDMKYRIIILIIIIISLGQILYIIYTRTHTQAHRAPTQCRHHPSCRCYTGGVRPTMTKIRHLFTCSTGNEWPVGASLKQQSREDVLSVNTNSWRHLPKRSSKNCDLQFANTDRQTDIQT